MKQFRSHSAEDTRELGRKIGAVLKGNDLICLIGDLGTGKTALTGGMAEGLGIKGYITSPTFTIVNEYNAYIPLYHFDVYRLSDPDEMFEIGFEEYLYGNGVVVIEWADMIKDILPRDYIRIEIKKDIENGVDERIITIEFSGEKYEGYESQLTINNEE